MSYTYKVASHQVVDGAIPDEAESEDAYTFMHELPDWRRPGAPT